MSVIEWGHAWLEKFDRQEIFRDGEYTPNPALVNETRDLVAALLRAVDDETRRADEMETDFGRILLETYRSARRGS